MPLATAVRHHVELFQVARRRAREQVVAKAQLSHADAGRSGQQEHAQIAGDVFADARDEDLGARRGLLVLRLKAIDQFGDLFGVCSRGDPARLRSGSARAAKASERGE
jgi:hypothetical protein